MAQNQALTHIYKFLKPNGQFVMNCIVQPSQVISDLENTKEDPTLTTKKYPLTDKNTWIALLEKHNFKISSIDTGNNWIFKDLDEFLIFWEATSHGKFSRKTLGDERHQYLLKKYPGEIAAFGKEILSLLAVK